MQQLTIEHKKVKSNNTKQVVSNEETLENMREVRGASLSRNVFRIVGSDTFYCKSESKDIWYFVRFESYWSWCSCLDNSIRHTKCKHIFAVEYSIKKGTLKDVDKLPQEVKRDNMVPESYRDDDYDF